MASALVARWFECDEQHRMVELPEVEQQHCEEQYQLNPDIHNACFQEKMRRDRLPLGNVVRMPRQASQCDTQLFDIREMVRLRTASNGKGLRRTQIFRRLMASKHDRPIYALHSTVADSHPSVTQRFTVINKHRECRYQEAKLKMEQAFPSVQVERKGTFHCTRTSNLDDILCHGLTTAFAGAWYGCCFGAGIYVATSMDDVLQYRCDSTTVENCILVCDVLCAQSAKGSEEQRVLPDGVTSLVNTLPCPTQFVLMQDDHVIVREVWML